MIATLMGTPYQPDTTGAIVFLEDVHEEPYRIDRMLTTLALGGMFDKAAGIVFGRCSDCGIKGPSLSLEEILRDRFGGLNIPAISGLSFGHIEQKLVLPIGARATLDADGGTVRVEEGAVG
jgi:muramoyltetrapeptide carboxypeptidase